MAKLVWDDTGNKKFETGVKKGVLYVADPNANYGAMVKPNGYGRGVAWNGLTAVTESNSGAEETALWADDIKYASLRSAEEFSATIEAYQCPREFYQCDGTSSIANGVTINQQGRKSFAFSYVTTIGNDVSGTDYGYKIHIIYGATASPSERAYQTINDSPDAITLSWEITTTPVNPFPRPTMGSYSTYLDSAIIAKAKPTAHFVLDVPRYLESANRAGRLETAKARLKEVEECLYGDLVMNGYLLYPGEIACLLSLNGY